MVQYMQNKVVCSWCGYDVFLPISKLLVKCYNCENLKTLDEIKIVTGESELDTNI